MLIEAGPQDQQELRMLRDYGLIYAGAPQAENLILAGPVSVTLQVSSDCPDTDIVAKLIEVLPDGQALLLMDGVARAMLRGDGRVPKPLHPGEQVELVIQLGHIHHTVYAGHRLEIDITGSNFPRRALNANSGNLDRAADADLQIAANTVHHGQGACYVELTVLT